MKRKALSLVLAMLIILASFPLTAFAADEVTITKVDMTATKTLMENYDGHIEYESATDGTPFFYYYIDCTRPDMTLTFSDGSTKNITFDEYYDYFEANMWCEQGAGDKELKPGTHTKTVALPVGYDEAGEYVSIRTEYTFTIEENPIQSISAVATKPLTENVSGWWEDKWENDENGESVLVGKTFFYHISETEPTLTVTFTDGTTQTFEYGTLMDEKGYSEDYDGNSHNNPYKLGNENIATVSIWGVKAEFAFEIIEDPVKSITVTATKDLVKEKNGYWELVDYEDESKGKWFSYYLGDTNPTITVEYKNGDIVTSSYDDCYATFSGDVQLIYEQSSEKQLTIGTYTGKAQLLGHECDFTFNVIENPIKSIAVNVTEKLQENKDGYWQEEYAGEDGDTYIGEYYYYVIDEETATITINYKDASKAPETYNLDEVCDIFDENVELDLGQSLANPLKPGTHTGKATFMGVSCDFTFEITENPVKSISAQATRDLVENEDCWVRGEDEGEPYLWYVIDATYPEVTVTYTDGTVKTYTYREMVDLPGDFQIAFDQSAENPLKPGTHTATLEYAGRKCEFSFTIIEDPVSSIVITPTKDLVENTNGYMRESDDKVYFYYYLEDLMPNITINYKDGTKKVYDYLSLIRFEDVDFSLDKDQDSEPLKLGENTATANLGAREVDFKFNIVKQSASQKVKSLVVTPEQKLIKENGGYIDSSYDPETGEMTPAFYRYSSSSISYTAVITFEDGTTKTYKNLGSYDILDGSDFDVYFEQSYTNQYKVGKNAATATYRNATCEFQVEMVENNYTAVSISGDNELVVTLTKADGTKENYKAREFYPQAGDNTMRAGELVTDAGTFDVVFTFVISEDRTSFENIQLQIFEDEKALKSNVLKSNEWLDMITFVDSIDFYAAAYADGYSERFYNREFKGVSGDITGTEVDDVLTICTYDLDYTDYENNGIDEKGRFAILTLEEAEDLVSDYFDVSKIDFTSSPMYNAGPKEIKVYFMLWNDAFTTDEKLEYTNGKFVYKSTYKSYYNGVAYPVTVVLDANGYVESISFVDGVCGNIKTINAKNANGGVEVTYTAAENASEYEIYRSLNGGAFEKIGTTSETTYLDKTAASGKTYTYKVRPKNATSQGAYSAGKTVAFLAMPTTTVAISKTGFTVKWTKVDGATKYRLYRAEYVNGKWSSWTKLSDQKASVSSYADKTVKAGGVYKYTVRAMNSDAASAYKGTKTIVYLTTPTVKIANASSGVKGTFSQVAGATGYIIYRAEYNSSTKKWSSWTNLGTAKSTAKSFTDKTAASGKTYRYTVRAINGDSKSLYTASNTLLYLAEPDVTIANAKAGITVKWTKSAGATGYTVYRSEYNASTKKWTSWKNMGTAKADKTSWTDKSVKAGVAYKYTVRAVNGKVKSSFTSTASLVRLTQPTVKIANAKAGITVKWTKSTGATGYTVYRSELANGKWASWKNMGTTKATASSWTDKSAVSGTTYRYTVRAVNGKALSSYAATSQLMFLSEPTVKIANAATGVKVSWNKVEGATGYTVYRSEYNASTKKWSKWSNRGTAKADKSSWTDKKVTSGVQYKYTVRAINGSFKSTYTGTGALLYLAQPTVTATKATNGVAVKWNKIAGAKSYIVYRQEKVDGEWTKWSVLGTAKASANSFTDKTAESGKEYRYTVRAVNGKVKSTYKASNTVKG